MERARPRQLSGYSERHHVIPLCIGGNNTKENIVTLTAPEHFVAHQLLVKMHPGNAKLIAAVVCLTRGTRKLGGRFPGRMNNKLFGWLRAAAIEAKRGRTYSPEWRANISVSQRGKVISAECRGKLAAFNRGKKHSAETRAKMSASHRRLVNGETAAKIATRKRGLEWRSSLSAAHIRFHQRRAARGAVSQLSLL